MKLFCHLFGDSTHTVLEVGKNSGFEVRFTFKMLDHSGLRGERIRFQIPEIKRGQDASGIQKIFCTRKYCMIGIF